MVVWPAVTGSAGVVLDGDLVVNPARKDVSGAPHSGGRKQVFGQELLIADSRDFLDDRGEHAVAEVRVVEIPPGADNSVEANAPDSMASRDSGSESSPSASSKPAVWVSRWCTVIPRLSAGTGPT
jgi:hypothetical protein